MFGWRMRNLRLLYFIRDYVAEEAGNDRTKPVKIVFGDREKYTNLVEIDRYIDLCLHEDE